MSEVADSEKVKIAADAMSAAEIINSSSEYLDSRLAYDDINTVSHLFELSTVIENCFWRLDSANRNYSRSLNLFKSHPWIRSGIPDLRTSTGTFLTSITNLERAYGDVTKAISEKYKANGTFRRRVGNILAGHKYQNFQKWIFEILDK